MNEAIRFLGTDGCPQSPEGSAEHLSVYVECFSSHVLWVMKLVFDRSQKFHPSSGEHDSVANLRIIRDRCSEVVAHRFIHSVELIVIHLPINCMSHRVSVLVQDNVPR